MNGHLRSSKFVKELDFNIIISAERDLRNLLSAGLISEEVAETQLKGLSGM